MFINYMLIRYDQGLKDPLLKPWDTDMTFLDVWPKFLHVSSFMWEELHWLPKQQHTEVKVLILMCKCLAVSYIPDRRFLHCAVQGDLFRRNGSHSSKEISLWSLHPPGISCLATCNTNFSAFFCQRWKTIILFDGGLMLLEQLWWWASLVVTLYKFALQIRLITIPHTVI